jgi:hypothetical protein
VGEVAELLVQAHALLGSGGRLLAAKPRPDIDHKDLIFDELGGFRSIYAQVKGGFLNTRDRLFHCQVHFRPGHILSNHRLVYVFCILDLQQIRISHVWVIPSRDFNRLANRFHLPDGRIVLEFAGATGGTRHGGKWGPFRVEPTELGRHLYDYVITAPPDKLLKHAGLQLVLRQVSAEAKPAAPSNASGSTKRPQMSAA